ncbi:MAG: hypothetical protein GDA67_10880 [Nitrospira sp. CR1.3]|nr:hypothetical protein [Nitrospira sp. CR1.3]
MMNRHLFGLVVGGLLCCGLPSSVSAGVCQINRVIGKADAILKTHLSAGCTDQERESHAVQAGAILAALRQGKAIDLSGVVILGDLRVDDLPLGPPPEEFVTQTPEAEKVVRVVSGAFSLVNSIVRGAVRHQSAENVLVVKGPVDLSGTRFEQSVDLSRATFMQPVRLSGAVFLGASYFVQARFLRELSAEKTAFGPHTRFHRARFHGPVTFQQSGFSGLAEFLEVEFRSDADFSRTFFKLGTGFSGSHFQKLADFSEALFDREAFFTFARFDGDAVFRRATFRSTADFDDAQFKARDDFSKVFFEGDSRFARVTRPANGPAALGLENPQVQYAITLSLLVFSAVLIAYLIRSR